LCLIAASFSLILCLASSSPAQTLPYSFEVDRFSVPERGLLDDFDDGTIDPNWTGLIGTANESGSTIELSDPGVGGFSLATSSTVPEPGSAILIGLGLAGLATRTRVSRRQAYDR
jgi:hypothetical protein